MKQASNYYFLDSAIKTFKIEPDEIIEIAALNTVNGQVMEEIANYVLENSNIEAHPENQAYKNDKKISTTTPQTITERTEIEHFILPDATNKIPLKRETNEEECLFAASINSLIDIKPSFGLPPVFSRFKNICHNDWDPPTKGNETEFITLEGLDYFNQMVSSQNCQGKCGQSECSTIVKTEESDSILIDENTDKEVVLEYETLQQSEVLHEEFSGKVFSDTLNCSNTSNWKKSHICHLQAPSRKSVNKCNSPDQAYGENAHLTGHYGKANDFSDQSVKTFGQETHLPSHIRKHTGNFFYKNKHCNKALTQNSLVHCLDQTGRKPLIGRHKECSWNSSLLKQSDYIVERPFKCNYCGKAFTQNKYLNAHLQIHSGLKPFRCHFCSKTFRAKAHLHTHLRTHTGEKPFTCNSCDKAFSQETHLSVHIRTHTKEKPFQCSYCNKAFTQGKYLTAHLRIHSGLKPFRCHICSKSFREKIHLHTHLRTHTGEKPFTCSRCDKAFSQETHLSVHIRTHTGERPFQCSYCDKAFIQSSSLAKHKLIHTRDKPFNHNYKSRKVSQCNALSKSQTLYGKERPYKCHYCDKAFIWNRNLDVHLNLHSGIRPFKCDFCYKAFRMKSHLRAHLRTHTGEKPYTCNVCEKAFAQESHLIAHIRTHTGEKPYKCNYCDKNFTQSSALTKHLVRHSGEYKPFNKGVGQSNVLSTSAVQSWHNTLQMQSLC